MEINDQVAYSVGFILGDGNLSKSYLIRAVDKDKEFSEIFAEIFSQAFDTKPKIYFDSYNNSYVIYKYSKKIWEFLVKELGIPEGTKSRQVEIPEKIMNSNSSIKSACLSGLFDAEGTVTNYFGKHNPNGYLKIQFKVCSKNLARDVFVILESLKIKSRIYEYNDFSLISIHGKRNCGLFSEKIGFKHPKKSMKLKHLL